MLSSRPLVRLQWIRALTRLISLGMILTGAWLCMGELSMAHGQWPGRWQLPASTLAFLAAFWAILGAMLYRVSAHLSQAWAKEVVTWVMASIIISALMRVGLGLHQAQVSWPWWELLAIGVELTLPSVVIIGIAKVKRYG